MADTTHKRSDYSNDVIKQALENSAGVVAAAANQLGVHRTTLAKWIEQDAELEAFRSEIRESVIDLAESHLFRAIKAGDFKAIAFFLRCFGRPRGYVERTEITGKDGGPIEARVVQEVDLSKLSRQELKQLAALKEKARGRSSSDG
ncbi:MAG: helix-turn-helix domain-containing protein [Beijerinckiaceae bacterium]